uniref:Uncharacterized protein n=1 Tax=Lygus hesperus TaxID=30085 RepID=A0A146M6C7_LYGHE
MATNKEPKQIDPKLVVVARLSDDNVGFGGMLFYPAKYNVAITPEVVTYTTLGNTCDVHKKTSTKNATTTPNLVSEVLFSTCCTYGNTPAHHMTIYPQNKSIMPKLVRVIAGYFSIRREDTRSSCAENGMRLRASRKKII